jgi:hypothetical protein
MKTIFTSFFALLILIATGVNGQATYSIKANETWSNNGSSSYPNPCFKCTFNLADGVVLTIEKDVTFSEVKFNGGTVIIYQRDMMLWTSNEGLKNYFTKTQFVFKGAGKLTGNGPIVMTNSGYTFFGKTEMTSNHSLEMFSSTITFKQNSSFLGQGTIVSLTNSKMIAGDGLSASMANIKMNGAKLQIQDKLSGIDVMNSNNNYFNWSDYYSAPAKKNIVTTDNKKNCGAGYPNTCSGPLVYGPIAITSSGFSTALILPVIISDFSVAVNNKTVAINWSTKQESNSAFFAIERSNDGSVWNQVAQIKAAGNSSVAVNYNFNDLTPVNTVAYYRLKMVDLDGKFVYSDVKSVRSAAITTTTAIRLYPNPANEFINVVVDAKISNAIVTLVNQAGQVVATKNVSANSSMVTLQVSPLQAGLYVVKVSNDKGSVQTAKLIVQH